MPVNVISALRSLGRGVGNNIYNFGFNVINGLTRFNNITTERQKLAAVLSSPAVLKVFALQCDLFSMGKVTVEDANEKEIPKDPFLSLLKKPNPFQNETQFLWDFMFWNMLGTDNVFIDSKIVDRKENRMYFLDPSKMIWPTELQRQSDHMVFSDQTIKERGKQLITYRYNDGSTKQIPLEKLLIITDLTNGVGNWYKGTSRIDALYKIISNSEFALDAKNINIRYSGKFLIGSPNETGATEKLGLSETERNDIRDKIDTNGQQVWPLRSMIQIRRFVENMAQLELDKAFLADYFLIGNMYNIPRDVLEAYNSSTYENQEKARAAHVNYTLEPKGNSFMDGFETYFGYDAQGKNIKMSWNHLPFMQVFEKEKAEVAKVKIDSLTLLLNLGVDVEQANEFLGTNFEITQKNNEQDQQSEVEPGQTDQTEAS